MTREEFVKKFDAAKTKLGVYGPGGEVRISIKPHEGVHYTDYFFPIDDVVMTSSTDSFDYKYLENDGSAEPPTKIKTILFTDVRDLEAFM